jgi:lysozyme
MEVKLQDKVYPYKCPASVWTIGFGDTQSVKNIDNEKLADGSYQMQVIDCFEKLDNLLDKFENQAKSVITRKDLTYNQWTAIISLVYNIGIGAFKKTRLLKHINNSDVAGIKKEWNNWDYKGLEGLKRRRQEELDLFLKKM